MGSLFFSKLADDDISRSIGNDIDPLIVALTVHRDDEETFTIFIVSEADASDYLTIDKFNLDFDSLEITMIDFIKSFLFNVILAPFKRFHEEYCLQISEVNSLDASTAFLFFHRKME